MRTYYKTNAKKRNKKQKATDKPPREQNYATNQNQKNENCQYIIRNSTRKECQRKPPHQLSIKMKSKQHHATL